MAHSLEEMLAAAIQPHLKFPQPPEPLPDKPLSCEGSPAFLIEGQVKCVTDLPTLFALLKQQNEQINEAVSKTNDLEEEVEELKEQNFDEIIANAVKLVLEDFDFGDAIDSYLSDTRNLSGLKDVLEIPDTEGIEEQVNDLEEKVDELPTNDDVRDIIQDFFRHPPSVRKTRLAELIDERIDEIDDHIWQGIIKSTMADQWVDWKASLEEYRTEWAARVDLLEKENIPEITSVVLEQRLQATVLHRGFWGRLKWLFTGR